MINAFVRDCHPVNLIWSLISTNIQICKCISSWQACKIATQLNQAEDPCLDLVKERLLQISSLLCNSLLKHLVLWHADWQGLSCHFYNQNICIVYMMIMIHAIFCVQREQQQHQKHQQQQQQQLYTTLKVLVVILAFLIRTVYSLLAAGSCDQLTEEVPWQRWPSSPGWLTL